MTRRSILSAISLAALCWALAASCAEGEADIEIGADGGVGFSARAAIPSFLVPLHDAGGLPLPASEAALRASIPAGSTLRSFSISDGELQRVVAASISFDSIESFMRFMDEWGAKPALRESEGRKSLSFVIPTEWASGRMPDARALRAFGSGVARVRVRGPASLEPADPSKTSIDQGALVYEARIDSLLASGAQETVSFTW
jgi:hypothetical protein